MKQFVIIDEDSGQRLDTWLNRRLGQSRNYWQRQIRINSVKINGLETRASHTLESNDVIEVSDNNNSATHNRQELPQVLVVYEDSFVIVVEKPSGLLVHAVPGRHFEPTLSQFAARHSRDTDTDRPGIVHRLDRETSGLIIIAKDASTKTYLQEQFRKRQVNKVYIALLEGHLKQPEALIDLPIGRKSDSAKRGVIPSGKPAQTTYKTLREYPRHTLVEALPKTGRTHQLRVHFAHLGHPIVGDAFYGHKPPPLLGRLFLHAAAIEFKTPDENIHQIKSPLPQQLSQFLDSLEPVV